MKKYFIVILLFAMNLTVSYKVSADNADTINGNVIQVPENFLKTKNAPYKKKLEESLNKKISVHFNNTHIREIIQYISTITKLSIILDETPFTGKNKSKYKITIHFDDIPVRELLWYLCSETDLIAFFDEDISKNIPVPIIITSEEIAKEIKK